MRVLIFILQKEFRQIFRNPVILRLILIVPVIQLIVIPFAADYEVKNINLAVVDQDQSSYSRLLTQKMTASKYFKLKQHTSNQKAALQNTDKGLVDAILTIPPDFEKILVKENKANLFLAVDAVNGVKAGLASAYAGQIIRNFNAEVREQWMIQPTFNAIPQIEIRTSNWYNPHINYQLFMVPGILAILVSMVGSLLAALNIVAEKEAGTIEQLNVTPVKKWQFIIGKLFPFWVLGMVSITLGMLVAYFIFGLLPLGSFGTVYLLAALYLIGLLGIGLLVSTLVDTQQQATLITFFIMMIFVLMSGLFTPIESMPEWARQIALFNPPTYFIRGIRAVYIKGSSIPDLQFEFLMIILFAFIFNVLAIWNYRKRV